MKLNNKNPVHLKKVNLFVIIFQNETQNDKKKKLIANHNLKKLLKKLYLHLNAINKISKQSNLRQKCV